MSLGERTPKPSQDRGGAGQGRAPRSSGSEKEGKGKGRGNVLGLPQLGGLCLFLPPLLPAAGFEGRGGSFGGAGIGVRGPRSARTKPSSAGFTARK